ncbi:MAG: hypothetical protein ACPG8W_19955 [Candidatus Promineifilaceae bacterium]
MSHDENALQQRFYELRWAWHDTFTSDPDKSLAIIQEAIDLAGSFDSDEWQLRKMEMQHWYQQGLVFNKRDYARALPATIRSAVEARKPKYANWRTKICLYQDLIAAHVGQDAISNAPAIEAALSKMEAEAPDYSQCRICLAGERSQFEMWRDDLDVAEKATTFYLSKARFGHNPGAHTMMCVVYFRRENWQLLLEHAQAAIKGSEDDADAKDDLIEGYLWQAVAQLKLGKPDAAKESFVAAETEHALIKTTLSVWYYLARAYYHEHSDQLTLAIATRQQQLEAIAGKGALREEAEARVELCRLEGLCGEGISAETITLAQAAIGHLKVPAKLPAKLETILKEN